MKEWSATFIVCMLVVTLIENITPNGKHEKYIKYVTAVIFLLTLINPLISFLKRPETYDIPTYASSGIDSIETENGAVYPALLKNHYKTSLKTDIEKKIEEKYPQFDGEAQITIEDDYESENFGALKQVDIYSKTQLNKSIIENIINDFYSEGTVNININVITGVE